MFAELSHFLFYSPTLGIDGAKKLGIEPIFSAKEMADPEVEHLGIMAYAAYFRQFKPVKIVQNKATMDGQFNDIRVRQEVRHLFRSFLFVF